jgi:hypothetical protein
MVSSMQQLTISQQDRDELQSIVGPEFALPEFDDPSFIDKTVDVFTQLGTGFFEGYTTIHAGGEPLSVAGKIARGVGNLAGFIGFVPDPADILTAPAKAILFWGSKGLQKAIAKRIVGKSLKKAGATTSVIESVLKSGDLIKRAQSIAGPMGVGQAFGGLLKGRSVPMLFSSSILKAPAVKTTLRSAESIINGSRLSTRAKNILKGSMYGAAELSPAMAISGFSINPWDDRDLSERITAGFHGLGSGAAYGGAFGLIGNVGTITSKLMIAGKPRSADRVLKALAGAVVQGGPSTLRKDPMEDQVFNWMLGGYFGATTHPWQSREVARFQQESFAENQKMLEAMIYMKDWGGFVKASGIKKLYDIDPAAGDIALREMLEAFDAPDNVIRDVLKDPEKFSPINYGYKGNTARASEAAEKFGADPSKLDEYLLNQERATKAQDPSAKPTDDTIDVNNESTSTIEGMVNAAKGSDLARGLTGLRDKVYQYTFKPMVDVFATKGINKGVAAGLRRVLDHAQAMRGKMTPYLEVIHSYGRGEGVRVAQSMMEPIEVMPGVTVPKWRLAAEPNTFPDIKVELTAHEALFLNDMKNLLRFGGSEMAAKENAPKFEHRIEIFNDLAGKWVEYEVVESGNTILMKDMDGNIATDSNGRVRRWETRDIENIDIAPRISGEDLHAILAHYNPENPNQGVAGRLRSVLRKLNEHDPNIDAKIENYFKTAGSAAKSGRTSDLDGGTSHLAQEYLRAIDNFPSTLEYNGYKYQILEANPIKYADAYTRRSSSTISYMRRFGQGVRSERELTLDSSMLEPMREDINHLVDSGLNPRFREVIESKDKYDKDVREPATGFVDDAYIGSMQRVLNGLPADTRAVLDPNSPWYRLAKRGKALAQLYRGAMLTASVFPNIAESAVGNIPAFLGYKALFRGLKNMKTGEGAEGGMTLKETYNLLGALTLDPVNMTIDPTRTGREYTRVAGDIMKRAFGHHYVNELQEHMAVAAADAKWRMWGEGEVASYDHAFLKNNLKMSREDIELLMRPKRNRPVTEAENAARLRFIRQVAQYLTSAKLSKGRDSLAANSRWFGEVFPFMSYGMKKVESMKDTFDAFASAYKTGRKDSPNNFSAAMRAMKTPEAYLFGRVTGSTIGQGALGYMILSLAFGGATGLHAAINEAKDEPVKFMFDSFLYSTLTGPFAAVARYASGPDTHPAVAIAGATFPGMVLDELYKFSSGNGVYKDQTAFERVSTFFTRRIPASAPLSTALATVGLSDRDTALEGSLRAYWKWRYDEFPPGQFKTGHMEEEHKKFRMYMRRAMNNIKQRRDPRQNINNAIAVKDGDTRSAVQSIRSRRLLYSLTSEQRESLRSRVGDKAYEKLVEYDNILTYWAENISGVMQEGNQ